jgi:hypothetical protein
MNKLEFLRKLAGLGKKLPKRQDDTKGLTHFRNIFMRDADHIRRTLFGANVLRRQRLDHARRRLLRILDVHPDLLSPIAELRYEPSYTRLLAYHFDPHRTSLAPRLLEAFLRLLDIAPTSWTAEDLPKATVTPEYTLADGRVDVRILLPSLLVFVEVKVDAREGDAQLERYDAALQQERGQRTAALVYLTLPDDEAPTSQVAYEHLSFDRLLAAWLPLCEGSDDASRYLARFMKSLALTLRRAGPGTFDDWSFGLQRAALNLVEEIDINGLR